MAPCQTICYNNYNLGILPGTGKRPLTDFRKTGDEYHDSKTAD